jgi:hypothetical protein
VFSGSQVSFHTEANDILDFTSSRFEAGKILFSLQPATMYMHSTHFGGAQVQFHGIWLDRPHLWDFLEAKFTSGVVSFKELHLTGGNLNFEHCVFSGADVDFAFGDFSGGRASFLAAEFESGNLL